MTLLIELIDGLERHIKHLPGRHDQMTHGRRIGTSVPGGGYGEAYEKALRGAGSMYLDEGPSGWVAGPGDVTRGDQHKFVEVAMLRDPSRVDLVRTPGVASSRTFEQRRALRKSIVEEGLHQGISVFVEQDGSITISDGTHRLEAVDELGWKYIPAYEIRYFGNVQREGLIHTPVEELGE